MGKSRSAVFIRDDGVPDDEVDIGDIVPIAGAWRAIDPDSLARYDFNRNNMVDVGDIMTVAQHLGEPCP